MFKLEAKGLAKRFHRQWIFKDISFEIGAGQQLLITGANGSGKSTLIRILAGQLSPTKGHVSMFRGKAQLPVESWYRFVSWSGPYMDLYPDLNLREAIDLHFRFREPIVDQEKIAGFLRLEKDLTKQLRHFSSGMLHRLKVGLCIFSKSDLLLLDEATTNMDEQNSNHILELLESHLGERALIFASNKSPEFGRFENRLEM